MDSRRDVLAALGAAFAGLSALPALAETGPMILARDTVKHLQPPFGEAFIYYQGATDILRQLEILNVRLKPGMSPHPPHEHPEEEIQLVLEGSGEFIVDGKTTPCSAGSLLYAAPGHLHGIQNTGTETLSLYVFKWAPK